MIKWSWLGPTVLFVGILFGCDSGTTGNFFDEDLAVPRPLHNLTVTVLPDEGGTVSSTTVSGLDGATSITCGQGNTQCAVMIREGSTIELTATPAATYHFESWAGRGCFASTAIHEVTVDTDTACIVSFVK